MNVELDSREASVVLAALRNWQEESESVDLAEHYEAYFEDQDPPTSAEIDVICTRITEAALRRS